MDPGSSLEEVRQAAADLGGLTPYLDRSLAGILSAWLASVCAHAEAGDQLPDQDWDAALRVARWSAHARGS